jgi:hypothetical protein
MKDAREGMSFVLLLAQKVLLMRLPELKPDELSPVERQLLAAAITEELYESTQVRRFLATLSKQKKHAKLSMALMIILLPRLKRHGIIPEEMDLEEITGELVNQSVASQASSQPETYTPSRPNGSPNEGRNPSWDSVSVAAGGSPFPDRGNGFREVHVSGVANETAPLRSDSEDETGRYSMAGAGGSEVAPGDEESPFEQDRTTPRPKANRPEAG